MTDERDEIAQKIVLAFNDFSDRLVEIASDANINVVVILLNEDYMLVSSKGCRACSVDAARAFIEVNSDAVHEGEKHDKVH